MDEKLKGQRSPQELAEDFLRLGDFIKEPQPHPLLEIDLRPLLQDKPDFLGIEGFDTLRIGRQLTLFKSFL